MRLTRLEIIGFKSFAERTVLSFQPGITAIVGPNGCGKSNIADAILWCLGEQSPKTLRGDRMEDVLFNGSTHRPPSGLAEVSLTLGGVRREDLDHTAGEYSEITLTRRLYRSGESEYLLNRVPCRLRDMRDLLIETGAGAKGHTILEQGKVDELINASPLERRALVEETAGITKYKIRKNEALRKLESTEQNLLRVRDIVGEVKRQLASLDRQAKKAERYRQTYEELKTLEVRTARERYRAWTNEADELTARVGEVRVEEARLVAALGALDVHLENEKTELTEIDRRLHEAQTDLIDRKTRAQHAQHRLEVLATQDQEWRAQSAALVAEIDGLTTSLDERHLELTRGETEIQALETELTSQTSVLASREAALAEAEQRMTQIAVEIDRTRHQVFAAQAGMAAASNLLTTLAARRAELEKRRERYRDEIETARAEVHQTQTAQRESEVTQESHARSLATLEVERTALRGASVERQAALQEGEAVLTARRDDLTKLRARLESLVALQRDLVGYEEGVRRVLHAGQSAEPLPGLLGLVADVLEIPAPYERAIEAVLEDRLQGVIVKDRKDLLAALSTLEVQNAGRATFVPIAPRSGSSPHDLPIPQGPGIIGAAKSLLACRPGFETVCASVLDRVMVVEDRTTAVACWEHDPHGMVWVTVIGEVFLPSGVVRGGSGPRPGLSLLERKRTIKTLDGEVARAESDLTPLEASVATLRLALEADRGTLERTDATVRDVERLLLQDRTAGESLAQGLVQLERRLALLTSEDGAARDELSAITADVGQHEAALASHRETKNREEQLLLRHGEADARLKVVLTEAAAAVTDVRLDLAARREKREHLAANARALLDRIAEMSGQRSSKQGACDQLEARIAAAVAERETVIQAQRAIESTIVENTSRVAQVDETRAALVHRIREREDATRVKRREIDELQHRLQTSSVTLAEARLRATQQVEDIRNRYQIDLTVPGDDDVLSAPLEEVEAAILRLKESLAQLGGANLSAIDEYRELEERYVFLAAQETDLTESVTNLHAAIAKINHTTKDLFVQAFDALNEKFGIVYASFFEKGHAELRLDDPSRPLESGVEIVAQPPGKKLRHISLLSGGEKALTAIALLFASFLIHPSPFCVMDEIDAPLDEENVRRFTRALRPMTAHSQFLVVTHNRRTMEQADALYGVTMQEPGISKLVSVKLHTEATVEVEIATAELPI